MVGKKFKSEFLGSWGGIPKRWESAFESLVNIKDFKTIEEFIQNEKGVFDQSKPFTEETIIPYTEKIDISVKEFKLLITLITALCFFEIDGTDKIEDVVKDLITLKYINKDQTEEIERRIKLGWDVTKKYGLREIEIGRALDKTFPRLDSFSTQVISVPIIMKRISLEKDQIDDYKPEISFTESAVVLQIDVDKFGEMERFNFGVTQKKLDLLIDELKAVKKELLATKKLSE